MGMRFKIMLLSFGSMVVLLSVQLTIYYRDLNVVHQLNVVDRARLIANTMESNQDGLTEQWNQELLSGRLRNTEEQEVAKEQLMHSEPFAAALRVAKSSAEKNGYQIRTPRVDARKQDNLPDAVSSQVLSLFATNKKKEHVVYDEEQQIVRYFRPIQLAEGCTVCHGDPNNSMALWGNSEGEDPFGHAMEGMDTGQRFGALEIVQPLIQDATAEASNFNAYGIFLVGAVIGITLVLFWMITNGLLLRLRTITDVAKKTANCVTNQTVATEEMSTTVSEMLAAAQSMSQQGESVAELAESAVQECSMGTSGVQDAVHGIRSVHERVEKIAEHMLGLGAKSQQISGVLDIITELSEQTNLLSLNASIEAAGAGEAGKRFAVVASEIRKLAERATDSTEEIRSLVEAIQETVNTAIMATEEGTKSVQEGMRLTEDVDRSFDRIVSQVASTTESARSIELCSRQQVTAIEQMEMAVRNIETAAQESEDMSKQVDMQTSVLIGHARLHREK